MFIKINEQEFVNAFDQMDRADNFTRLARMELFRWYEDLEEDLSESIELDPIAICCDWQELTGSELLREYGHLLDEGDYEDEDDRIDALRDAVEDETYLIVVDQIGDDPTYLISEF